MKSRCHLNVRPHLGPCWFTGGFQLRATHTRSLWNRSQSFQIPRPWLLVGRLPAAELRLADPAISPRHLFLFQDENGLFALDLNSRAGTAIGPLQEAAAWLNPGDHIKLGPFRLQWLPNPRSPAGSPSQNPPDPLDLDADPQLPAVRIDIPSRDPIQMCSRLLVLGRSSAAGICIPRAGLSRVHAVLIRHHSGLYLVDLASSGTWLQGEPVHACARFDAPESSLRLGRIDLMIRISQPSPSRALVPVDRLSPSSRATLPPRHPDAPAPAPALRNPATSPPAPPDPNTIPPHLAAILSELVAALQTSHHELLQRQDALRHDLLQQIESLRSDVASGTSAQARTHEQLRSDLNRLREEIRQRFATPAPIAHRPAPQPAVKLPPLHVPPPPESTISQEDAVAWLLERFQNQRDQRGP